MKPEIPPKKRRAVLDIPLSWRSLGECEHFSVDHDRFHNILRVTRVSDLYPDTAALRARKDVNVSMVFADEAAVKMVEAIRALSEARTAMVGVHNELNEAKLRLGIRTKMGVEKPFALAETAATTALRDVG